MAQATMFEAKTQLSELVRRAQRGEKVIEETLEVAILPIDPQSMYRAARFQDKHADPFDRMIAAQAIQYDLSLRSAPTPNSMLSVPAGARSPLADHRTVSLKTEQTKLPLGL